MCGGGVRKTGRPKDRMKASFTDFPASDLFVFSNKIIPHPPALLSRVFRKIFLTMNKNIVQGIKRLVYTILISSLSVLSFTASAPPTEYVFYKLKFRVASPVVRPDLEEQMLNMINRERQKEGLNPLVIDPDLVPVARRHSEDMFIRGYFSHYTPEKAGFVERFKASRITYSKAGENLAMAPTLQMTHNNLMKSPGHRKNILRPNFGRVGIGIMDGGRYGIMVTQDFRN
jgi:uncharacterized protein YkwD